MRLCLIGGVIILLVIIIGIIPSIVGTDWGSPHCGQEDVGQILFRSFRGFLCHCMQSVLVICFFVWRGVGGGNR